MERSWYKMNPGEDKQNDKCDLNKKCGATCGGYDESIEQNQIAVTTRVSGSLIRVGHFELFGQRAADPMDQNHAQSKRELLLLYKHMLFREFPELLDMPIELSLPAVCLRVAENMTTMISEWMRVGYVQSNFNSDNCLISGKTMDYGPFGFMEKYDPDKNFWTGGGAHFSFMNQMNAGKKNYVQFVNSLKPLINNRDTPSHQKLIQSINAFDQIAEDRMNQMWKRKLGLTQSEWTQGTQNFVKKLLYQMKFSDFDWTMFWRQLTQCPLFVDDRQKIHQIMNVAFFQGFGAISDQWKQIFDQYIELLKNETMHGIRLSEIARAMRLESPKYVPREWMLVKAYTDAQNGSYGQLLELEQLFKNPYDEQKNMENKYYKLTPLDLVEDKPGFSQMSCSS
jgi:uncharacterized protein YdiU (UPF0061 family)